MPPEVFYQLWIPAAVAAALGLALLRGGHPSADATSTQKPVRPWAGALILGAAAVALYLKALALPTWPPSGSNQRLFFAFVAATAIGMAAGALRSRPAIFAGALLAGAAAGLIALWPLKTSTDATLLAHPAFPVAVGAVLVALTAAALTLLDRAGHRVTAAFILTGLALAVGGALATSGNLVLGQLGWGVGVAAAVVTVLLLAIKRGASLGSGGFVAGAAVLGALLLVGNRYGSLGDRVGVYRAVPPVLFGLCAPLSLGADRLIARRLNPQAAAAVRILAAAIPAAVALALCADPEGAPSSAEYGS